MNSFDLESELILNLQCWQTNVARVLSTRGQHHHTNFPLLTLHCRAESCGRFQAEVSVM